MSAIVFGLPGNESLAHSIADAIKGENGIASFHQFPDGESLVRIESDFTGKEAIVVSTLNNPDSKILPLYFLCKTLKKNGAAKVILVAPYLPYMRQDKSFHAGEVVSADYFASLLSSFIDCLITVDPHLHRHRSLSEIFSIPCHVVHSVKTVSEWIKNHVNNPVLIGPDSESLQWVAEVANEISVPFVILHKERQDDRTVKISIPHIEKHVSHTPVILDDIISTAHTMIETVHQLTERKFKPPFCVGVHALFAGTAYQELLDAGAHSIITCNTISHVTNQINLNNQITEKLKLVISITH